MIGQTRPALEGYNVGRFTRGRSAASEALWIIVQALLVSSWLPGSKHRCWLLRAFGARIGAGVVIKPRVHIKFPWRLEVGNHSWIGEGVWIDNLAKVSIGSNCCISQAAYLCTGSHNWASKSFDLLTMPITIHDGAWIAARAVVGPGVTVSEGAVLGLGSVATTDLEAWSVYLGTPSVAVKMRKIKQ